MDTYQSTEELEFPREYDDGAIIILDHLNEKERNDPRVQTMFRRSRHILLSNHVNINANYQNELFAPTAISIKSLIQIISKIN